MAGDWIPIDHDFATKPEVLRLCEVFRARLSVERFLALHDLL